MFPKRKTSIMVVGLALVGLTLGACSSRAQTTNTPPPPDPAPTLWDTLTTGSNYFAVPFMTMAQGDHTLGGGLAIGYQATEALAPVVRFDEFGGKGYLCNLSLQLQVPRRLMGKVPVVPFAVAGAGFQLTTASVGNNITISAGDPVGIIGVGAYVPLDFAGSQWFFTHSFLVADYEHWAGVNMPKSQQNQFRFGLGVKF